MAKRRRAKKGFGSVFKCSRSPFYYFKVTRHGKTYRQSTKTVDRVEAERFRAKYLKQMDEPVIPDPANVTFDVLARDVVNDYVANGYRSIKDLRHRFDLHILPYFGKMQLSEIKHEQIEAFRHKRAIEGASKGEIANELSAIKRAYNLGLENNRISMMPLIKIRRPKKGRQSYITEKEYETLCQNLPPEIEPLFRTLHCTGWRVGEVQGLLWTNINLENNEIMIMPESNRIKNGVPKIFPITPELRKILMNQRKKTLKLEKEKGICIPWVFHRNGKRISTFWRVWDVARKKTGLEHKWRHDLRRSAARRFDRLGLRAKMICKLIGWESLEMLDRYNIADARDLQEVAKIIGRNSHRQKKKK